MSHQILIFARLLIILLVQTVLTLCIQVYSVSHLDVTMKYLLLLLVALVFVVNAENRLGSPEARKLGGTISCGCCGEPASGKQPYPGCKCPLRKYGWLNNNGAFERKCEEQGTREWVWS